MIQAVDLASKLSATTLIDLEGGVLSEVHSWKGPGLLSSDEEWVEEIVEPWQGSEVPLVLAIEDLPHSLKFQSDVKRVCRIQGRICDRLDAWGYLDRVLFVPPALWQRAYEGVWRQGPAVVVPVAKRDFDYDPPDTGWRDLHYKDRTTAKKAQTDYCAAYLIARWLLRLHDAGEGFDVKGTSRYS